MGDVFDTDRSVNQHEYVTYTMSGKCSKNIEYTV